MACIAHGRHVANPLFAQSSSSSDSSVLEGMLQNAQVHGVSYSSIYSWLAMQCGTKQPLLANRA